MVILNAYASKIDLSTAAGQKVWRSATAGLEKKFDINNDLDNAESFKQQIDKAFDEFCWGSATTAIPIEWDDKDDPTKEINVMTDFREVTVKELMIASGHRFGCKFESDKTTHNFKI